MPFDFTPLSTEVHQKQTLGAAVFTMQVPTHASGVLVQALTQNARFTLDGTDPSATKGFQLKAGDPPIYIRFQSGITYKWIQETSGAILEFEWSK